MIYQSLQQKLWLIQTPIVINNQSNKASFAHICYFDTCLVRWDWLEPVLSLSKSTFIFEFIVIFFTYHALIDIIIIQPEIVFAHGLVILPIVTQLTTANTCWTKTALGGQIATTTVTITPLSTPVLPQICPKQMKRNQNRRSNY